MGNTQVQDFPPVRQDERRELKLTRKITPKEYQQVSDKIVIWEGFVFQHESIAICLFYLWLVGPIAT